MQTRRSLLAALATGASGTLAGCALDAGRGPTTPDLLQFSLPAFEDGRVPDRFTCRADDGSGVSPPVVVESVPTPTEALGFVVEYPNSVGGTFTHWIAWNLPADTGRVPAGVPDEPSPSELRGGVQGENGLGRVGYAGLCPPPTEDPQTYWFTLFALRRELEVPAGSPRDAFDDAVETATLASKRLTATFQQPPGAGTTETPPRRVSRAGPTIGSTQRVGR